MNRTKINEIFDRIRPKQYLTLVETSVCKIPEAIEKYDPSMFICFNYKSQQYEVHSLRNLGFDTKAMSIPWDELDQRTLELVAQRDQNRRPLKEIIKEIDDYNQAIEDARERQRANDINSIARDQRGVFKRFAEEMM